MKYYSKVLKIAKQTRKWIKSQEYFKYSTSGACAIASWSIVDQLRKIGLDAKFCYGRYSDEGTHCWVEFDKNIIDVTKDQFEWYAYQFPEISIERVGEDNSYRKLLETKSGLPSVVSVNFVNMQRPYSSLKANKKYRGFHQ